ncbi:MAG: glycosyltransferase family 4 protein [Alphaproteobacteria bacterium]|nr:glycosyltransferase family 4 protein [Alphaproteobacteria bacterium]
MKLLMVARRFPPDVRSGTETVFENLWQHARRRHEVRLVVGFQQRRDLVPPDAVAVDLRGARRPQAWKRLWVTAFRELRRFRPDAVLANSIETPTLGAPTACIVHDLNFGLAQRGAGTLAREWFYRAKCGWLDAVVAVSQATADRLVELGVDPERIHVIHNGVDLDVFRPVPRAHSPDEPADFVRFACPGRILPGKGQHLALDALARLPRRYKERAHLVIAGAAADPIFVDQLRIQAYNQPVEILTNVPRIAPIHQGADVILFPTLMEEGFGFTAIDGMACGKPVIWSDQPAVREATGGVGFPVPQGDVEAMRDAMRQLMDDPDLRAKVGAEGRAFVEQRYAWDRTWARYEAVLQGIMGT